MKSNPNIWRWYFVVAALEAGAAFVALLVVPHSGSGYSAARVGVLVLLAAGFAGAGWMSVRPPRSSGAIAKTRYAVLATVTTVFISVLLFLLRYLQPERLLPYYERLAPPLWYMLVVSAEFAVFSLVAQYGLRPALLASERGTWFAAALAFAALLAAYVFVALTRIGLTPDSAYWGEPGVPVLGWQFAAAAGIAACVFVGGLRWRSGPRREIIIAAAIWLVAVAIWLSVPNEVLKNSFYAPINPPSNQPFPNSDAGYYDSMAESLLVGYPYQGDIPTRPMYVVFLAGLHAILGEQYSLIIIGQTLLLALIPVMLYLLGKRLHSRAAGVLVALVAISREWNSLLVSSETRVSNTKMLLADLPTLLLVLLACLFVVRWVLRKGRMDALLAGGALGLLFLLRTQSLLLVPMALAMALIAFGLRGRGWLMAVALFVVGLMAAIAPWMVHNYMQTGQLTMDAPFQYQIIASQYKYTGNLDIGAIDLTGKSLTGILLTFILKDPKFVAGFISSHFFATLIDSLLALPLVARYDGLLAPLNLYWMSWPAGLDAVNAAVLIAYLALLSIGIGAAWKRLRWAGLLPLMFGVTYALSNGIARFSGWRYDLPADWVAYFYAGIGVAELLRMGARLLGAQMEATTDAPAAGASGRSQWAKIGLATMALALVGGAPWMAEGIAQPRYANQGLPSLVDALATSDAVQQLGVNSTQVQAFLANPQTTLQIGRMLYPRFFSRGTGLPSAHPWAAYAVRDFPRVGFLLLNQSRHDALIEIRQAGQDFAQGSDVIILGCQRSGYIEVRLLLFADSGAAYLSAPLTQACK